MIKLYYYIILNHIKMFEILRWHKILYEMAWMIWEASRIWQKSTEVCCNPTGGFEQTIGEVSRVQGKNKFIFIGQDATEMDLVSINGFLRVYMDKIMKWLQIDKMN